MDPSPRSPQVLVTNFGLAPGSNQQGHFHARPTKLVTAAGNVQLENIDPSIHPKKTLMSPTISHQSKGLGSTLCLEEIASSKQGQLNFSNVVKVAMVESEFRLWPAVEVSTTSACKSTV